MSALLTIEAENTNDLLDQMRHLVGWPTPAANENTLGQAPEKPPQDMGLAVYSDDELMAELQARAAIRNQVVVVRAARGSKSAAPKRELVDSFDPDQASDQADQATDTADTPADTAPEAPAEPAETDKDKYDRAIRELAALFGQGGLARGLVLAAQKTLGVAKFIDLPAERADELLTVVANIRAEVDAAATADSPV